MRKRDIKIETLLDEQKKKDYETYLERYCLPIFGVKKENAPWTKYASNFLYYEFDPVGIPLTTDRHAQATFAVGKYANMRLHCIRFSPLMMMPNDYTLAINFNSQNSDKNEFFYRYFNREYYIDVSKKMGDIETIHHLVMAVSYMMHKSYEMTETDFLNSHYYKFYRSMNHKFFDLRYNDRPLNMSNDDFKNYLSEYFPPKEVKSIEQLIEKSHVEAMIGILTERNQIRPESEQQNYSRETKKFVKEVKKESKIYDKIKFETEKDKIINKILGDLMNKKNNSDKSNEDHQA